MTRIGVLGLAGLFAWGLAAAPIETRAQAPTAPPADGVHLGVASCAGSTCHGAVQPLKGSVVAQNEYIIWSRRDKHAKAYAVLSDDRSQRIAKNLGLGDARTAQICLSCHADDVPADQRGPQFQISDGVGCEACHGGARGWLGVHIAGGTHADNLKAGTFDAVTPLEPFVTRITDAKVGFELVNLVSQLPHPTLNALLFVTRRDWAEKNRDTVQALRAAIVEADDFIRANPDKARQYINQYTKMPMPILASLPVPSVDATLRKEDFDFWAGMMQRLHMLQQKPDTARLIFP